jgi:hypothetical protein
MLYNDFNYLQKCAWSEVIEDEAGYSYVITGDLLWVGRIIRASRSGATPYHCHITLSPVTPDRSLTPWPHEGSIGAMASWARQHYTLMHLDTWRIPKEFSYPAFTQEVYDMCQTLATRYLPGVPAEDVRSAALIILRDTLPFVQQYVLVSEEFRHVA